MSRRTFVQKIVILIALLSTISAPLAPAAEFKSELPTNVQRYWIAPEYWSNPLEDWQINEGRIECLSRATNRNVHLLSYDMNVTDKSFEISVEAGLLEKGEKQGSVGFRIGVQDEMEDYRSRVIFGRGIDAGITTGGRLYIQYQTKQLDTIPSLERIELTLKGEKSDSGYSLTLTVKNASSGDALGSIVNKNIQAANIVGNVALTNNYWLDGKRYVNVYQNRNIKGPRFWFENWTVEGGKIDEHKDRTFGPILWSMYSLSRQVMKMTALLPPIGDNDNREVELQIKQEGEWKSLGKEAIDADARTATFRIEDWNDQRDVDYRLVYPLKLANGSTMDYYWPGTVRKDPKEKDDFVLAAFCCQTDYGFPHTDMLNNLAVQNPDLLFFAGDQIYEHVGGYGIIRFPGDRAILNYLRKFYLFGWAFGDVMRSRPTLCLPDDHDVFQGNVWGNGGNAVSVEDHDGGGFVEPPEMVNVVHRTNTAHHPDFYDPTPIQQNISVYYGDMLYGGVSFALVGDRMFKSGPKFTVTTWQGRPDHVKDPNYDVDLLDKPGLVLLGDRQLKFLHEWGQDWRGALMKCVLSETIFCNVATHHGGDLAMFLQADLDSNGWPQSGRNRALEEIRRAFAVHVAGDQHLPSLLQHGVDDYRDACWSFCVPAISVGYQRAWYPDRLGFPIVNRPEHNCPNTGDYRDGLGNLISVYAIGNPVEDLCTENRVCTLQDKSSGYGVVRFHKPSREMTFECWRLQFDANDPQKEDQFCGWPKTVSMFENYGREAKAWLPTLKVSGLSDPVVQVIREADKEIVYTVRILGTEFTPKVFEDGTYTIRIGEQDNGKMKTFEDVKALQGKGEETLDVRFE